LTAVFEPEATGCVGASGSGGIYGNLVDLRHINYGFDSPAVSAASAGTTVIRILSVSSTGTSQFCEDLVRAAYILSCLTN